MQDFQVFLIDPDRLLNFLQLIPGALNIVKYLQFGFAKRFEFGFGHQAHFVFGIFQHAEPGEHLHQANIGKLFTGNQFHRAQKYPNIQFRIGQTANLRHFLQCRLIFGEFLLNRRVVFGRQFQIIIQRIGLLAVCN